MRFCVKKGDIKGKEFVKRRIGNIYGLEDGGRECMG